MFRKAIILVTASFVLCLWGCQSNDAVSTAVYIPKPVNKKVLIEVFTNSFCFPCVNADNYLDQITSVGGVTYNDTSVIPLCYHVNNPSPLDSLYQQNTQQSDERFNQYYGVYVTPTLELDGSSMGQYSASTWTALIDAEFETQKYLTVTLSNTFNGTDSGSVTANITPAGALPTNDNVLHMVIVEDSVPYITAPNGIHYPSHVMRYMITGGGGQSVSLNANQTATITNRYGTSSRWNKDKLYIIVFVQCVSTKQVYGVERIKMD